MRLAVAVGRTDVDAMMTELSYQDWAEWLAFLSREPVGPAAWDARIGWVLAVLVQAITGQKTKPGDYAPQWQGSEMADWRTMKKRFLAWRQAHAGHR